MLILKVKKIVILPIKRVYSGITEIVMGNKQAIAKTIGKTGEQRRGTLS